MPKRSKTVKLQWNGVTYTVYSPDKPHLHPDYPLMCGYADPSQITAQRVHLFPEAEVLAAMERDRELRKRTYNRKVGKWVDIEGGFTVCSCCGASPAYWEPKPRNPRGYPPFCHECGAAMEVEDPWKEDAE